jgi:hypothetical protein
MAVIFTNKVVAAHYEADVDQIIKTRCYYGYISNISATVAEQLIEMKHPGFRLQQPPEPPSPPAPPDGQTE